MLQDPRGVVLVLPAHRLRAEPNAVQSQGLEVCATSREAHVSQVNPKSLPASRWNASGDMANVVLLLTQAHVSHYLVARWGGKMIKYRWKR